jgi:hypothetical protein
MIKAMIKRIKWYHIPLFLFGFYIGQELFLEVEHYITMNINPYTDVKVFLP